jgi:hypothetical protein
LFYVQVHMSLNGWPTHISNPTRWLDRAEKARDAAEGMTDPVLKQMMFDVAVGYERLAKRAEERTLKLRSQSK